MGEVKGSLTGNHMMTEEAGKDKVHTSVVGKGARDVTGNERRIRW